MAALEAVKKILNGGVFAQIKWNELEGQSLIISTLLLKTSATILFSGLYSISSLLIKSAVLCCAVLCLCCWLSSGLFLFCYTVHREYFHFGVLKKICIIILLGFRFVLFWFIAWYDGIQSLFKWNMLYVDVHCWMKIWKSDIYQTQHQKI